ncbi:MAG: DEAD/DEAH box helicase family protein [Anaerolineae bacterium]|nr:DEAD/DEAH box helicase family protein [Anaerolineae bacterium]
MTSIVAIDLETTGLDPARDAIIEIGAVRFNGNRIEDEWSTLINPNRPIPPEITQLTGITNSMVKNAPVLDGVIQELEDFIGDSPLVGHNVSFDLAFLQNQGIAGHNIAIDTYELASFLLPTASRYNLGALCLQMGVILQDAHRALDDARATGHLYQRLFELAGELPLNLIAMFVRLGEPFGWGALWPLQQLLKTQQYGPIAGQLFDFRFGPMFEADDDSLIQPLEPNDNLIPLDMDAVVSILDYGGPFSRYFPNYENRPEQVKMLEAVTEALSTGQHLMVEAGTGTGKSFAYLIPASLWAMQNNTRVVISTNTINLQDQLIKKDIPDLRSALNLDLRATVLKGRGNYLCPRRLEIMSRSHPPENVTEMRVFAKVMVWLYEKGSGDKSQINLNGPYEQVVWSRLSADFEGCDFDNCPRILNNTSCPYHQAHQAALSAHILIVNHALLLADIATGNRVLPPFSYIIADEAHHIEDASTNALSYRISEQEFGMQLRELGGKRSGILNRVLATTVPYLSPQDYAYLDQSVNRCADLSFRLEQDIKNLFACMDEFLNEAREGRPLGVYSQQVRIIPATRTMPGWTEVEITWEQCNETLTLLINLLDEIHRTMSNLKKAYEEDLVDVISSLGFALTNLLEVQKNMDGMLMSPSEDFIYWAELDPRGNRLSLQMAPLHVGPLMEEFIWHKKDSVILTSATLTANGEFDYLRNRLYAADAEELTLGSPFDYENAALLYIANDIPEPHQELPYLKSIAQTIVDTAKAIGGNMLVLFTSYAQLKKVSKAITPVLADKNIQVFTQGEGASANSLVETFRTTKNAVLLGTRSFWEGVDIPGNDLTCVVITKLPFDVPSDPIIAARSETFESPFFEYSLPEAILKFRQGFGRLIRTQTDRGIVIVLDRRVLTKSYGRAFLDSLPPCQRKVSSLRDIPKTAARWLNI